MPRSTHGRNRTIYRGLLIVGLAATVGLVGACTPKQKATWGGGSGAGKGTIEQQDAAKVSAAVSTPAANATNVAANAAVSYTTSDLATSAEVKVTDPAGRVIPGTHNAASKKWTPRSPLQWGTTYTVTVTAAGADGTTAVATSSFTTVKQPQQLVNVSSFLGDGQTVGVGMPLMITFGRAVPENLRADVQRKMTVTTVPAQVGSWYWLDGQNVHYRPKTYWKAGTKIDYRVAVRGVPMGTGWFGGTDLNVHVNIGSAVIMNVDNASKSMTITKDGKVIRKMPVSLGKKSTPSSSGTLLVMERFRRTIFDTRRELGPKLGYRAKIEYAQRLTWGGEFIHAAPWSVAQQGHTNTSHGCVNVSTANAAWLFNLTKIGDVVVVKGTERTIQPGNGWTDWNRSWSDYVQGSALPVAS